MKKITKIALGVGSAFLVLGLGLAAFSFSTGHGKHDRFVEGRHYKILPASYSASESHVDNFYWLNCSTCYMFEGILRKSSKEMGFDVSKIHATSNEKWLEDSKLDTTFRILNRAPLIESFYDLANTDKTFIGDKGKINNFLDLYQIDRTKFWGIYNSPSSLAMALEKSANAQLVDIKVVPTFVVSGKYKILLGGLRSNEELPELIDFLVKNQPLHNEESEEK
jgi:thiol:disulfide interchange protein DsbA